MYSLRPGHLIGTCVCDLECGKNGSSKALLVKQGTHGDKTPLNRALLKHDFISYSSKSGNPVQTSYFQNSHLFYQTMGPQPGWLFKVLLEAHVWVCLVGD